MGLSDRLTRPEMKDDPLAQLPRGTVIHLGEDESLNDSVLLTTVNKVVSWARRSSIWPVTFGLACCAIEMMATASSRYDISRFGMELFRASPRQSDLMIVSGRVSRKMAPVLRRVYDQMPEPRVVVAVGICATSGGVFRECYNVSGGIDQVIPVDVYVPGCAARPESIIDGIVRALAILEDKRAKMSAAQLNRKNDTRNSGGVR